VLQNCKAGPVVVIHPDACPFLLACVQISKREEKASLTVMGQGEDREGEKAEKRDRELGDLWGLCLVE